VRSRVMLSLSDFSPPKTKPFQFPRRPAPGRKGGAAVHGVQGRPAAGHQLAQGRPAADSDRPGADDSAPGRVHQQPGDRRPLAAPQRQLHVRGAQPGGFGGALGRAERQRYFEPVVTHVPAFVCLLQCPPRSRRSPLASSRWASGSR
jgi:hypothetical protein